MTQVLARKWRPKFFAELVGQEHVVRALGNALKQQRLHHAYLFTGTRGVGKTTLARIIAKALNCETGITDAPCGKCTACTEIDAGRFVDLVELDAASNTQVDNMRELLENALYAPSSGRFKVYIIDEVHMLSRNAFNAMLKTLEEPPAHVKFILATTDPQKIPVTVLSRCLQFNLKQIPQQQIAERLRFVLDAEKIAFEPAALALIARAAQGSLRDSLSLLDQAIAHGGGRVDEASVRAMLGAVDQRHLHAILDALALGDGAAMMAKADEMAARSLSFEAALLDMGTLLHRLALAQQLPASVADDDPDRETVLALAQRFAADDIQLYYQIALQGRSDIGLAPDEYAGFTMTLLRMLAFMPADGDRYQPQVRVAATGKVSEPRLAGSSTAPATSHAALDVNASWETIVAQLGLIAMTGQLARNCAMSKLTADEIELSLPKAQERMLEGAHQGKLKAALQQRFGNALRVTFKVVSGDVHTPAVAEKREQDERQGQAVAAIANDPFVKELQESFGGSIRKNSIQPLP
ncbi:MAG: DNA polymerase III subunit gamma/tau [Burkholderiales bacterium]